MVPIELLHNYNYVQVVTAMHTHTRAVTHQTACAFGMDGHWSTVITTYCVFLIVGTLIMCNHRTNKQHTLAGA